MSRVAANADSKSNQNSRTQNKAPQANRPDIPEERLAEFKDAFDMYDKDKSGNISVKELCQLFKTLGHSIPETEIRDLVDSVDTSGKGEITFDEFVTLLLKVESQNETEEEEVIRAFKVFDRDGNGSLSCAEFKHILTNLGDKFTEAEVEEIFKEADLDGDGQIDYYEFVNFWKSK